MGTTTRVSVASDGTQGNSWSWSPSISGDGRYVAFISDADNLVAGDSNRTWDIFVHDRVSGTTSIVSVASDGTQGNDLSWSPSISGDGRYVAFISDADNLVAWDSNRSRGIFVHDRVSGTTSRVSVASDGTQGNSESRSPSISGDGRYVAFESYANNLVPGDSNGTYDIFVHDRVSGTTSRVSVASDGTQGNNWSGYPSISSDGRYVAFFSGADNLVPGDTNGTGDIFVHDRVSGTTSRVSIASDGTQGNSSGSGSPSISSDGRYVAFVSSADNLVAGDSNGTWDIFVHDRVSGTTSRVSVASDGTQGNNYSRFPSISGDGRYVAFYSSANNLVPGDTNESRDIFVHDRLSSNDITYTLSLNPQSINEGNSGTINLSYTITRTGAIGNASQIDFDLSGTATNGVDYTAITPSTINFNSNQSSQTITVPVIGDSNIEPNETLILTLNNATAPGGRATIVGSPATANIINDDLAINGTAGNDTLVGTFANDLLNGLAGNDLILAKAGNDTLNGDNGHDTLNGEQGADFMKGDAGNDVYILDNLGDRVVETPSNGTDRVNSNISYTLPNYLENLTLTGSAFINGTGNGLNNNLTGNDANNTLDGKGGNDTMTGGAGNDTYIVNSIGDRVVETASNGIDRVNSNISYTLSSNLENLTLTGGTAINGTGNSLNNNITGNDGNNTLDGKGGNDTIDGGIGNDTIIGGPGSDRLIGGPGRDIFAVSTSGDGTDILADFDPNQDRVEIITTSQFFGGINSYTYNQRTGDLFFISGANDSGVLIANLPSFLNLDNQITFV